MSLRLVQVSKRFPVKGQEPHAAVSDVSLEVVPGKFYTLLGPSGCGKTTLLRLIAGFEQPSSGEILHNGRTLNDVPPYRRGFPMVFQSYALFPHLTVFGNVSYGLRIRRTARAQVVERVERALALLELQTLRDRHPAQLSGGQQQRVALARALVLEPDIILLDEPLSNLDAELRVSMRAEIRALQRRLGITALYVTHDQEEALAISDQVIIMQRGRIEQIGSPVEVYRQPRTEFVARFMGLPNILPLERTAAHELVLLGHTYDLVPRDPAARHVLLRSDTVQLRATRGTHTATIEESTFLGARFRLVLQLDDGTRLSIDQPWSDDVPPFSVGHTVTFDIVPDRLHFF